MRRIRFREDVWEERKSLFLHLFTGLALAGGIYFFTHSLGMSAVFPLALIATWLSFIPERRFRREYRSREPLTEEQFFELYYAESTVTPDIVRRLRPIYADFFELAPTRLRPHDRPPELVDIDTSELHESIEAEFQISISDSDLEQIDGSFDSIAQYLAERVK